jgi:hypothetical protein
MSITREAKLSDVKGSPAPLEDPVTITPADNWQAVARNLAQILNEAAELAAEAGEHARARRYRAAFANQCEAHGLKTG